MRFALKLSLSALGLLAVACGPSRPPTIKAFTVTPDTLAYGGGNVTLTWDVSEDVKSLRIEPGIGPVTGKSGTAQASVSTSQTFTLTATNEKGDSTAVATANVSRVTAVTGRVLGAAGFPVGSNVRVFIPGKATVVTDASGAFTIGDVTPPYDIAVVNPARPVDVTYYVGLTRADPVLTALGNAPPPPFSAVFNANLTGTFSTAAPPAGFSNEGGLWFESPSQRVFQADALTPTGQASTDVDWGTGTNVAGAIHALQWQVNAAGRPTSYFGYARVDNVTLVNGNNHPAVNVPLAAVQTAQISGLVTTPAGYAARRPFLVEMTFGKSPIPLASVAPDAAWSYLVPSLPGATFTVTGAAFEETGSLVLSRRLVGLAAGARDVNVDFPLPPLPAVPADNASGVSTATRFEWTAYAAPSAVYRVIFTPNAGTQPRFFVVTTATSATLPDLSTLGLGLPSFATYRWRVDALAPVADINAAASAASPLSPPAADVAGTAAFYSDGGPRTFITR